MWREQTLDLGIDIFGIDVVFCGMEMTFSVQRMHVSQSFRGHGAKVILHVSQQPLIGEQRGRIALLNGFAALQETVLLSLFVSKQCRVTLIDLIEREIE